MSQAPRALLTPAWERLVIGPEGRIDRRLYTFCTLERLQDGLRRRDLFVPASRRWGDPHARLLHGPAWEKVRMRVCRTLGRSPTPTEELDGLRRQLDDAYRRTAAQPADQCRRDDRPQRSPRRRDAHAPGQAGRARQPDRAASRRDRTVAPRGPDRGPPGGPGLDRLRRRIPPHQRGRRPGRRPRPEPLRRAPGRGLQHRAGAAGPPRCPRVDPRPALLGPAELPPRRDPHQGQRPAGRLPGPDPPGPGVGRRRGRLGRRPAVRRPGPHPQRRAEPEVLQRRPRRHLLQLHQRSVHRHPRHRRAGHDPRLPVHPRGPARAADQPPPPRGHERHGRLQRPGLRPVLAAGLPVQPPAGRLRRGPVLADGPEGRLRGRSTAWPASGSTSPGSPGTGTTCCGWPAR